METGISHEEYKAQSLGKRVDFDGYPPNAPFQCVDVGRDYCLQVWRLHTNAFGGSAYKGWINRATVFPGKDSISGFACVPVGSVVIFKPFAVVKYKKPGALFWSTERLTQYGHIGIVDYIDSSGVMRIIEQNGGNGNGNGLGTNAIRLRGYKTKDGIAGFILK